MTALATQNNGTTQPVVRSRIIVEDSSPIAHLMDTGKFEQCIRIAGLMDATSLMPKHLRGETVEQGKANCFLVVNQALRWNMDPFAVAPETYEVGGKLAFQGKLIAAVVNSRAGLQGRLSYKFDGAGDNLTITVSGKFPNDDEIKTITLSVKQARTNNQMWTKDPEQKLVYSGTTRWARRYCPEIILGVLTDDDIERMESPALTTAKPIKSINDKMAPKLPEPVAETTPETSTIEPAEVIEHDAVELDQQQGEPVGMPTPCPINWINDQITTHRPEALTAHAARKAFHAADTASWENLPRERQDEKYAHLIAKSFPWPK